MTATKDISGNNKGIRINKYISESGICSRREADKLIQQGCVTINGKNAEMGSVVQEGDDVKVNGKPLRQRDQLVYIALNKPPGIISTTERGVRDNIVDFMNYPKRIFPIGRLDRESEGLIFLTNDGDIVNKILRAGNNHEKEYIVTVNKPITEDFIKRMAGGVPILGTITKKCRVEKLSRFVFKIVLVEGMNRQIRRMCEVFGFEVIKLKRVRIMNVRLDDLPSGGWRYLTRMEMDTINKLIEGSLKTEEASK